MPQEIFIWQDSCYDVGGGGATVAVYQSLEEAIAAHPAGKSSLAAMDSGYEVTDAEWVLREEEDDGAGLSPSPSWQIRLILFGVDQRWESDLTYSSIQSITKATFGQEV